MPHRSDASPLPTSTIAHPGDDPARPPQPRRPDDPMPTAPLQSPIDIAAPLTRDDLPPLDFRYPAAAIAVFDRLAALRDAAAVARPSRLLSLRGLPHHRRRRRRLPRRRPVDHPAPTRYRRPRADRRPPRIRRRPPPRPRPPQPPRQCSPPPAPRRPSHRHGAVIRPGPPPRRRYAAPCISAARAATPALRESASGGPRGGRHPRTAWSGRTRDRRSTSAGSSRSGPRACRPRRSLRRATA